jgi:A/G-specific adenine glycosylase
MTRKTSAPAALPAQAGAFRQALLAWYDRERRRLPWRENPSAYGTVVSEFMLQQTQVTTVLPYFERWMQELPSFRALAEAPIERVLKLWEGLGYYTRARNLHRLAQAVASLPALPRTAEEWVELPGIGPYTAAAISSIAFGHPAACVDGNVVRILARLTRDGTAHRDSASASRAFAPLADQLLNVQRPGDHNQAMMELGATVCTRRSPRCLVCPVAAFCACRAAGDPESYPRLQAKATESREVTRVWCLHAGKVLLRRNPDTARSLAGLHELPTAEQCGLSPADAANAPVLLRAQRGITRYRITETIRTFTKTRGFTGPDLVWIPVPELGDLALSGPHRRWVSRILDSRES